jgi:DNA gyrase inhibitor GyrI
MFEVRVGVRMRVQILMMQNVRSAVLTMRGFLARKANTYAAQYIIQWQRTTRNHFMKAE